MNDGKPGSGNGSPPGTSDISAGVTRLHADLAKATGDWLLGKANRADTDDDATTVNRSTGAVRPNKARPGTLLGQNAFAAAADQTARLVGKVEASPYTRFLPPAAYADTFAPPGDAGLATMAERTSQLGEEGLYRPGVLPAGKTEQVASGPDPAGPYVGRRVATQILGEDGRNFPFRVADRAQSAARDPRTLVPFDFQPKGAPG